MLSLYLLIKFIQFLIREKEEEENLTLDNLQITDLNFGYSIEGNPEIKWKPTQVFDDGQHVYIHIPNLMGSAEAPTLIIEDGKLVNYRVKGPYYICDKLFDLAFLVVGSGKTQEKVIIKSPKRTSKGRFQNVRTTRYDAERR